MAELGPANWVMATFFGQLLAMELLLFSIPINRALRRRRMWNYRRKNGYRWPPPGVSVCPEHGPMAGMRYCPECASVGRHWTEAQADEARRLADA